MTKPSKTKTSTKAKRRTTKPRAAKPKATPPVATEPETAPVVTAETTTPEAEQPTAAPIVEQGQEPETATVDEGTATETAAEPTNGDEPKVAEQSSDGPSAAPSSAPSQRVSLGPVECRLSQMPTDVVLGLLSDASLRRVEAHKESPGFESVRQRMLATDGRATPVVFEDGDPPSILHGYDELAAAVDCGVAQVSVLLLPAGGAQEAQQHIVEMVRLQREQPANSEDDELFYRVHAED